MGERRRCDTKSHHGSKSAGPPGLRASSGLEVLNHGLTAAATKCRTFGAVYRADKPFHRSDKPSIPEIKLFIAQIKLVCAETGFSIAQIKLVCAGTNFSIAEIELSIAQIKLICAEIKLVCAETSFSIVQIKPSIAQKSLKIGVLDGRMRPLKTKNSPKTANFPSFSSKTALLAECGHPRVVG